MKKNCLIIAACLLGFASATFSQITYYKVSKGVKTALKTGEKVVITVDDKYVPEMNILVEIDVKAFQAKYNYDDLAVNYYQEDGSRHEIEHLTHLLISPTIIKKYANVPVLQFYLFQTPDIKDNPKIYSLVSPKIYFTDAKQVYSMGVYGRYTNGVEEYYDEGVWKKRNLYTDAELITSLPDITYKLNEEGIVNEQYNTMRGFNTWEGYKGMSKIEYDLDGVRVMLTHKLYVDRYLYPQIIKDIVVICEGMEQKVKNEPDKRKAIEMMIQWTKDEKHMHVLSLDKSILRSINKELKGANTVEEKIAVFKKLNP